MSSLAKNGNLESFVSGGMGAVIRGSFALAAEGGQMPFHRPPSLLSKLLAEFLLACHSLLAYASFYVFRLHAIVSKVSSRWREV